MSTRIKICCIRSTEEAALAIRHGASAVGLVSHMPSGPGPIPEADIRSIARTIPPGVASFLLTSETDTEIIIAQHRRCGTNTLQIVDKLSHGTHSDIRAALPGIRIVQVIHIQDESAVEEALAAAPFVDALLCDSGRPTLPVKELGGTGRVHDWSISRRIREAVVIPVFLAGGLTPSNVGDAIRAVRPFAVDVCSGVRTDGRLDPVKLAEFFRCVRETDTELESLPADSYITQHPPDHPTT